MARRRYLVAYDVADDSRRAKLMQVLRDHGDHVQYSVFTAELNVRELVHLKGRISELIHHGQDQVIVVDLGNAGDEMTDKVATLGRPQAPVARARIV